MFYKRLNRKVPHAGLTHNCDGLFLLMSVLSEALLTLVRGHFVLLSFLSARHMNVLVFCFPASHGIVEVYFKSFRYESTVA